MPFTQFLLAVLTGPSGLVGYDLWLLIIVAALLNKTTGKKAIPVFFDIIRRWPTSQDLAQGP